MAFRSKNQGSFRVAHWGFTAAAVLVVAVGVSCQVGEPPCAPDAVLTPPALPTLLAASGPDVAPRIQGYLRCDGPSARSGDSLFCYEASALTWAEAETQCQKNGGHLAHFSNNEEAKVVKTAFGVPYTLAPTLLIGLVEPFKEGEWAWMSGTKAAFQNWLPGEPNDSGGEDCGEVQTLTGQWNDVDCRSTKGFLCEKTPPIAGTLSTFACTGTLIVTGQTTYCAYSNRSFSPAIAERFCKGAGGRLAEMATPEKNKEFTSAIIPHVGDGRHLWIFPNDREVEGSFVHSPTSKVAFSAWRPGEPNNSGEEDCTLWGPNDGLWNDASCDIKAPSICRGLAEPVQMPCKADTPFVVAGCYNLAQKGMVVSASASSEKNVASSAVDGDCQTMWNAGAGPSQYFELDLGAEKEIRGVTLIPAMTPASAPVKHDVTFTTDGAVYRVALRYEGVMEDNQTYPLDFGTTVVARKVRITTTASPSWVAWREVGVFQCP